MPERGRARGWPWLELAAVLVAMAFLAPQPTEGATAPSAASRDWGMPDGWFAALQVALIVLAIAVQRRLWDRVWRWNEGRPWEVADGPGPGGLHVVEVAYLTGGRRHAVMVACLRLFEEGVATVPEDVTAVSATAMHPNPGCRQWVRNVARSRPARLAHPLEDGHPLEQFVARELAAEGTGRRIPREGVASAEASAMAERLTARGLLSDRAVVLRQQVASAPLVAVVGLGLARLAAARGPRDSLWWVVASTVLANLVLLVCLAGPRVGERTRAADRLLASIETEKRTDALAVAVLGPEVVWKEMAGAVASFGFMPTFDDGDVFSEDDD